MTPFDLLTFEHSTFEQRKLLGSLLGAETAAAPSFQLGRLNKVAANEMSMTIVLAALTFSWGPRRVASGQGRPQGTRRGVGFRGLGAGALCATRDARQTRQRSTEAGGSCGEHPPAAARASGQPLNGFNFDLTSRSAWSTRSRRGAAVGSSPMLLLEHWSDLEFDLTSRAASSAHAAGGGAAVGSSAAARIRLDIQSCVVSTRSA